MVIQQCEQTSQYVNKQHVTNETAFFVRNGGQLRKKTEIAKFQWVFQKSKDCLKCGMHKLFVTDAFFQSQKFSKCPPFHC